MLRRNILIIILVLVPCKMCGTEALDVLFHHSLLMQEFKKIVYAKNKQEMSFASTRGIQGPTEAYLSIPALKKAAYNLFHIDSNSTMQALVARVIAKERRYVPTHYVFYHGQRFAYRVFQDVIKALMKALHITGAMKHFVYLRAPYDFSTEQLSAQNFLDKQYALKGSTWTDHEPDLVKKLIAVNLSLFGNTAHKYECTFAFFHTSSNISWADLGGMLNKFFKTYNFQCSFIPALIQLYETYKTPEGNLLQIFIPKHKVDECVYLCKPLGQPWDTPLIPRCFNVLKKRHTTIAPILDTYYQAPSSFDELDFLQARLVLDSSTFLNRESGIKIIRYTTLTKADKKRYKIALQGIIKQIALEWLKQYTTRDTDYPLAKLKWYSGFNSSQ